MTDLLHRTLGGTIAVSTRLGVDLWSVTADPNRIELAVLNLTANARDAMPTNGGLRIETRNVGSGDSRPALLPPGDFVRLSGSDTGEGMPPEVLERLFERSSRPDLRAREQGSNLRRFTARPSNSAAR